LKAHNIPASKNYQQIPKTLSTCRTPLQREANNLLNQHEVNPSKYILLKKNSRTVSKNLKVFPFLGENLPRRQGQLAREAHVLEDWI
jgi:hypothetical protein